MTDKLQEVARALRKKCAEIDHRPDVHHADAMWFADEYAEAAIEAHEKALEAQGLVIVPREPSGHMLMAGRKRLIADMTGAHMGPSAENTYKAMLAALEGEE